MGNNNMAVCIPFLCLIILLVTHQMLVSGGWLGTDGKWVVGSG